MSTIGKKNETLKGLRKVGGLFLQHSKKQYHKFKSKKVAPKRWLKLFKPYKLLVYVRSASIRSQ